MAVGDLAFYYILYLWGKLYVVMGSMVLMLVMGGMVLQRNMTEILTSIEEQSKLEKNEVSYI